MIQTKPDLDAFERVRGDLKNPYYKLTCKDVVDVFGWPAMELFLILSSSPETHRDILEVLRQISANMTRRSK